LWPGGLLHEVAVATGLERLYRGLRRAFLLRPREVTLEANPATLDRARVDAWLALGLTRLSLGAQSFDAARLAALGRIHSPADTRLAAAELHGAGLDNFNLDLMYGLPGQEPAGALEDVRQALQLAPAHLSHYQLTLEPGTVFAAHPPALPEEDAIAAMHGECGELLAAAGLARYEVSAYARTGARCHHNLNYWSFGDYLGVGAGAHGKLTFPQGAGIVRTTQPREPRRYLAGDDVALARRSIPPHELPFEFMLNALRLTDGFEAPTFRARTGLPWESVAGVLEQQAQRGLLEVSATGYRPSARGLLFLNELFLAFLPETPKNSGLSALSIAASEVPAGT